MSPGAGEARSTSNRLADFEHAEDNDPRVDFASVLQRRGPSPSAPAPVAPDKGAAVSKRTASTQAPASKVTASKPTTPKRAASNQAATRATTKTPARPAALDLQDTPAGDSRSPGPVGEGPRRGTNIMVPVPLVDTLQAKTVELGITRGDLVLLAIETTYEDLRARFTAPAQVGGRLFGARRPQRRHRRLDVPTTPLGMRLTESDMTTLHEVVADLGAANVSDLASVALTLYLDAEPPGRGSLNRQPNPAD